MAKKKETQAPVEITPEDSVVPVFLVELTPEEEAERLVWAEEAAAREQKDAAKVKARESGIKKLAKLGLIEDEIAALIQS